LFYYFFDTLKDLTVLQTTVLKLPVLSIQRVAVGCQGVL